MSTETIAVDLDDVLADHASAFIEFSNLNYGTSLTRETYTERWDRVWDTDDWDEILRRAGEFHTPESALQYSLIDGSQPALEYLSKSYSLALVTARPKSMLAATHDWLERHFAGIFAEIHFVPIWEPDNQVTKADICQQIGAQYLVDDVVRHCNIAAEGGITALLFGGFAWHEDETVHKKVVPVKDWAAVLEYFDEKE